MQEITTLLQRGELTQALTLLEPFKRHPADPIIAGLLGRADSTQEIKRRHPAAADLLEYHKTAKVLATSALR